MSLSILGTGSALPKAVVTNQDLSQIIDTSDEWIRTRTGIEQRHILKEDETITGLGAKAALAAIENAGIEKDQIDFILCATLAGDYITPSLACTIQGELGIQSPAMDLNAACSGFLYGLEVAAGLLALGKAKKILLIAAENLSRILDWNDRSTCVLFGDGAAAIVVEPGKDLLYNHLTSHSRPEVLYAPATKGNCPWQQKREEPFLQMNGGEVYKFAVNAITTGANEAMEKTGYTASQIDHVMLHQANLRIIEAAQKKLGIPAERYGVNIHETGNTSAASIPILLDLYNRSGKLKQNDLILMSGFGAGLVTGPALLRWNGKQI